MRVGGLLLLTALVGLGVAVMASRFGEPVRRDVRPLQ